METSQKHIVETLMEYVQFLGVKNINDLPGLWEHKINDQWEIKCNGHLQQIDDVPPLCFYIIYNGFPAGILSVLGDGVICAGSEGNEENLRKAIEQKMIAA